MARLWDVIEYMRRVHRVEAVRLKRQRTYVRTLQAEVRAHCRKLSSRQGEPTCREVDSRVDLAVLEQRQLGVPAAAAFEQSPDRAATRHSRGDPLQLQVMQPLANRSLLTAAEEPMVDGLTPALPPALPLVEVASLSAAAGRVLARPHGVDSSRSSAPLTSGASRAARSRRSAAAPLPSPERAESRTNA